MIDKFGCTCELRHRSWNPITGVCETCNNRFRDLQQGLRNITKPQLNRDNEVLECQEKEIVSLEEKVKKLTTELDRLRKLVPDDSDNICRTCEYHGKQAYSAANNRADIVRLVRLEGDMALVVTEISGQERLKLLNTDELRQCILYPHEPIDENLQKELDAALTSLPCPPVK